MNRTGIPAAAGSRALECVVLATATLLLADAARADLVLLWQTLGLLFGN